MPAGDSTRKSSHRFTISVVDTSPAVPYAAATSSAVVLRPQAICQRSIRPHNHKESAINIDMLSCGWEVRVYSLAHVVIVQVVSVQIVLNNAPVRPPECLLSRDP